MDDDLPVNVIQDLYLEGVQGVMSVFIDLSLNYVPHEISKVLHSSELGGHISFNQSSIMLAFSQSCVCITIGTSLGSEQSFLSFWLLVS
jgi:hypothetical protein